jgi:hypothetical protein
MSISHLISCHCPFNTAMYIETLYLCFRDPASVLCIVVSALVLLLCVYARYNNEKSSSFYLYFQLTADFLDVDVKYNFNYLSFLVSKLMKHT